MPQILYRCSDDTTSACRADDKIKRAILEIFDDGGGYGRQRSLAWLDEVGRRRLVAESIGLVRNREIIHLIVHDEAGFRHDELAAEKQVYGGGE